MNLYLFVLYTLIGKNSDQKSIITIKVSIVTMVFGWKWCYFGLLRIPPTWSLLVVIQRFEKSWKNMHPKYARRIWHIIRFSPEYKLTSNNTVIIMCLFQCFQWNYRSLFLTLTLPINLSWFQFLTYMHQFSHLELS